MALKARRPGRVNRVELPGRLLTATLLLASFVLAVIRMLNPQRQFGEMLSHLQAGAFFLLLALGSLLGLASLWTVLGCKAVNRSIVLRSRYLRDPVRLVAVSY